MRVSNLKHLNISFKSDDDKLNKEYIKLTLRLRSGHFPSAKFGYLMGKVASPYCLFCNKIEDIPHLLMECVRNKNERESIIEEFKLNFLDVGLVQTVLASPKSKLAVKLSRLVKIPNG